MRERGEITLDSGIGKNLRNLRRKSLIGQIVLMLLSIELLFFGSFVAFQLPTATGSNLEKFVHGAGVDLAQQLPERLQPRLRAALPRLDAPKEEVRFGSYVAVIPLAVMLGYVLGLPLAVMSVAGFLILGVVGPHFGLFTFASGGGIGYWKEPGFGYLIGMVAGAWFAGWINAPERKSWRQLAGGIGAVLLIHLTGLLCLVGGSIVVLLAEGQTAYLNWQPWLPEQVRNLSWHPLPYDLIFSVCLIGCGFPLRWLVHTLTSPDIAARQRPRLSTQLEVLSETRI